MGVTPAQRRDAAQARLAAVVMAGAMVAWLGLTALGGQLGWPAQFVFLIDLAAIAAFIFALAIAVRLWRRRRA